MKLIKLSCMLVLALSLMHCSKSDDEVTLQYHQTKCADPWPTNNKNSDEATIASVKNFFETEHQIDFETLSIYFDNNIAESCRACNCLNGKVITATVHEQYSDELLSEGFYFP